MDRQQKALLELLKVLDGICRKYDITYYTAGGTVIGAIRHGGFIPWDDDIDVYMTRDEFWRFRDAVESENLKDYTLENSTDNPDYHAMIPRIVRNDTAMVCAYHMWGNSVAGTLIDIFILDPVPDDKAGLEEHYAKFNIYSDLLTPYVHSTRNPDCYYDLYDKYMKEAEVHGKRDTLLKLEKELFSMDEKESNSYMLRWASRPAVFPKDMMGEPEFFEFEGMMIPVPHDWYGYLTQLYGPDWFEIPYPEVIEHHTNIIDLDRSYSEFITERDRYIDQKEAEAIFDGRRNASIRSGRYQRVIEKYILGIKEKIAEKQLDSSLEGKKDLIHKWMDEGAYSNVIELYAPYFNYQMQKSFIGSADHPNWYRWTYPVIIPVSEERLSIVLMSLIMSGQIRQAHKLIGVYERAGKLEIISKESKLLKRTEHIQELYYKGQYEECLERIHNYPNNDKSVICRTYSWMAEAMLNPQIDRLPELEELAMNHPENKELQKSYGDYLYNIGKKEEAQEVYQKFLHDSRNGLLIRDIEQKTGLKKTNLNHETTEIYKPTAMESREQELLQQVAEICDKAGIHYVCSNRVAKLLLNNGTLGPESRGKDVYMDAGDAQKFIQAVDAEHRPDISLLYWGNNPTTKNFEIIYNDNNSVYMNFEEMTRWDSVGMHIRIVLLRHREKKNDFRKKLHAAEETMLTTSNLDPAGQRAISSTSGKIKRVIVNLVVRIIGKKRFASHLFKVLIQDSERNSGTNYYYRKNGPFSKKKGFSKNYTYLKSDFENASHHSVSGVEYSLRNDVVESFSQKDMERMKTKPYFETLYQIRSMNMNWTELRDIISMDEYRKLPWEEYGRAKAQANYYQSKYSKMWKTMCRHQDYIEAWEEYEPKMPMLRKLVSDGNYKVLHTEMADFNRLLRYYHASSIDFFVNPELNEIYACDLVAHDDVNFAEKLRNKAQKVEHWPF